MGRGRGTSWHAWQSRSQSFIHQVRILSRLKKAVHHETDMGSCRNPLFIKSEFSPAGWRLHFFIHWRSCVAILYSSSQNSLRTSMNMMLYLLMLYRQSQSFIHQVRILSHWGWTTPRWQLHPWVAILYSSSQNSLGCLPLGVQWWAFLHSRNPLFIKSEFSH